MAEDKARTVLWYMVFIGFAVNYMIRINLNITIVDMVMQQNKNTANGGLQLIESCLTEPEISFFQKNESFKNTTNEKFNNNNRGDVDGMMAELGEKVLFNKTRAYKRRFSLERTLLKALDIVYEENGFHWNEYQQGLALGSFFWIHWITQIPGGILAKKYGTKLVFGLTNVIGCWMCFILPIASFLDFRILIFIRVLQGLICGMAWPAMHNMTAQWIPPNERSKFVTAYLGSSVGVAVFYPLFGYIISWSSWEWVFYVCGVIGTIWYIGWVLFVFDTPAEHPGISDEERKYIEKSLGASVQRKCIGSTPWKDILTSLPVWMNVCVQWGGIWGLFTLMTQAPTYFKIIHGWNIEMTGILSGTPHTMRMIFAYCFSTFGDYLLRTEKMSRTNVRKLATTMCCIVNGIFVLALAFSGCNSTAAIVFLTLATAVHGAVSTGPLASIVDIAPNYAGIVLGISGMIGVLPGFISPAIVGLLTLGNQTVTSWKYVFIITAAMLIVSGVLYIFLCDSTLQKWNDPEQNNNQELQQIHINNILKQKLQEIKDENNDQEDEKLLNVNTQ